MNEQAPSSQGGAKRLLEDIFTTQGNEITCSEAGRLIGLAADLVLSDAEAQERFPALFTHLRFCPDCTEEYRMVSDYARREAAGQLRIPGKIPPVPAEFLAPVRPEGKGALIRTLFGGFSLAVASSAMRGANEQWQATITLSDQLQVAIQAEISSTDSELRTLHFQLSSPAPASPPPTAGSVQLEAGGAVEQDALLDNFGAAVLLDVLPGVYQLRLRLAGQEYLLEEFVIP